MGQWDSAGVGAGELGIGDTFLPTGIYRHSLTSYSYRDPSLTLRMTMETGRAFIIVCFLNDCMAAHRDVISSGAACRYEDKGI